NIFLSFTLCMGVNIIASVGVSAGIGVRHGINYVMCGYEL
ncbi:MAG: hypothetical protein ACI8RD_014039, partial [Bacillariaceae sp.]